MDDIEKHVDIIESTRIAPLEEQVKSIMGSMGDLKNLKATLDKVEADLTAKGKDITALKEARTSIEKRIGELEKEIDSKIDSLDNKLKEELSTAIGQCEKGLKTWVATQLEGYYTIAQTESLLAAIREDLMEVAR